MVRERFAALAAEVERATGTARTPEQVAEGFIDIAVGGMANAIKKISVSRGYDVTRYTLQCFGGAGGQHACLVADALGMTRVFVHPLAGVLSAYGMGLADRATMRQAAIELPLASAGAAPAERLDALALEAEDELERQGVPRSQIVVHRRVHVRYEGTDSAMVVPFGGVEAVRASFEAVYRQRFAFLMSERRLIVEAVSVEAVGAGDAPADRPGHALVAPGRRRRRRPGSACSATAAGTTPPWSSATMPDRGRRSTARRSSPSATPPPSSSPAGGRASPPTTTWYWSGSRRARRARRSAPRSTRCFSRCSTTCS